jgi:hypothetical protein
VRTASANLQAHIAQDVTTLCTLFKVSRRDGLVLGFTDHDQDVVYDGVTYDAETGYTRSAVKDSDKYSVDNLELEGLFNSDKITEADIRARLYDGATVEIMVANYNDLTMGVIERRAGTLGQVKLKDDTYTAEIRGLFYIFQTLIGEKASARCRSDVYDPNRCAANPDTFRESNRVSSNVTDRRIFEYEGLLAAGAPTAFVLTNPGAESPPDMTGWTNEGSANWGNYTTHLGISPRTGVRQFGGPNTGADCQMYQEVDFVAAGFSAANIDTGRYTLELTVWYNSPGSTADTFHPGLRFLDENHDPMLGMEFIHDGLAAPTSTWTQAVYSRPVPTGARYADLILRAEQGDASWISIEADDISAQMLDAGSTDLTQTGSYYDGGVLTWLTGGNQRLSMEIKTVNTTTHVITLFLKMPYDITEHDQFDILPGCNKVFATCRDKFNNVINFRGEPYVPGTDYLQTWPDAH